MHFDDSSFIFVKQVEPKKCSIRYRSPIDYMDGNNMPPAARVLKAVSPEAAAEALRR